MYTKSRMQISGLDLVQLLVYHGRQHLNRLPHLQGLLFDRLVGPEDLAGVLLAPLEQLLQVASILLQLLVLHLQELGVLLQESTGPVDVVAVGYLR